MEIWDVAQNRQNGSGRMLRMVREAGRDIRIFEGVQYGERCIPKTQKLLMSGNLPPGRRQKAKCSHKGMVRRGKI